jgi:hypothetical protein
MDSHMFRLSAEVQHRQQQYTNEAEQYRRAQEARHHEERSSPGEHLADLIERLKASIRLPKTAPVSYTTKLDQGGAP